MAAKCPGQATHRSCSWLGVLASVDPEMEVLREWKADLLIGNAFMGTRVEVTVKSGVCRDGEMLGRFGNRVKTSMPRLMTCPNPALHTLS